MNIKQFLEALAALDLAWEINCFRRLRAMFEGESVCPITAVANSRGSAWPLSDYRRAGLELGLVQHDITELVTCADEMGWNGPIKGDLLTAANRKDLI